MKFIFALLLTCLITACATAPSETLDVPSSALAESKQYGMLWIKPCAGVLLGGCGEDNGNTTQAKMVIHGSPGRLNVTKSYEDETALADALAAIDASSIVKKAFLVDFRNELRSRNLAVKAIAKPIYAGKFKQSRRRVVHTLPNDLSATLGSTQFPQMVSKHAYHLEPLFELLDVDYILALELLRFGIDRQYGPTDEPLNKPLGVAIVRVTLREHGNNALLFDDFSQAIKMVHSDWNTPPNYESLTHDLNTLLEQAVKASMGKFLR